MVLWSTLTPRLRVNTGRNTVIPTVAVSFSVRMTCRGRGDLRVLVVLRPWHRDFVSVGWHFLAGRPVLPPPDEIVRGGVALAAGWAGPGRPAWIGAVRIPPGPVRGPDVRRQRWLAGTCPGSGASWVCCGWSSRGSRPGPGRTEMAGVQ